MVARSAHRELARAELDLPVTSCAGNPFLLTQAGAVARTGASAEGLGSDPNRLLVARFSGLAPEVVRIAKAASVAGTRFWPQLVSAMTDEPRRGQLRPGGAHQCGLGPGQRGW